MGLTISTLRVPTLRAEALASGRVGRLGDDAVMRALRAAAFGLAEGMRMYFGSLTRAPAELLRIVECGGG